MKITKYSFVLLLLLRIQYSFAQVYEADTAQDKKVTLDEVVISANKADETKKTVAQQVQVITATEIANAQAQSTADLIANTGNVFVQKSQMGGGSPVIRGFEASRIVLEIDGVRLNNLIYRAGHLQNIVTLDNNNLERVEVLFGPSSTIYGSDALGGVIHLYTKRPKLSSGDEANIKVNLFSRYGSVNNESTSHVDFNYGTKKFGSLTSFTYATFGDLMGGKNQNPFYTSAYGERPFYVDRINGVDSLVKNDNRFLQVGTAYKQYDFMQKFLYMQNSYLSHSLNLQFSNSSDIPRYDRLTDPSPTGLKSAEWYYGPQTRLLAAYDLNLKKPANTFQSIHFGVNYQFIEESRHNRNFGSDFLNHRIENVGVIGANLDFQKTISRHKLRFGADMQLNSVVSTANQENISTGESGVLDTRYPDGDNTMHNYALYLSHSWEINDEILFVDGIRIGYSSLNSTLVDTATQFHLPYTSIDQKTPVYSGSAGIIHSPNDELKLSAMVSTGFRVPNVDDLVKIFESSPGTVFVPNVDLKPEKTINYELGITNIFNNKTRVENFIYYTQFIDAIVADEFTFNGEDSIMYDGVLSKVYANQNKREAYIYGFSSNLLSQLNEHFSMSLALNYAYGRIKTDSSDVPLDHISPFMARYKLAYSDKKFNADFFINYNGWKRLKDYNLNGEDNEQYATPEGMPAWCTVNLHVSYVIYKYVKLQAGIDNIFDTQYRTFSSGINAPGRNAFVAVKANF